MRIAYDTPDRPEPHAVIREDDTHGVLAADPVGKPVDTPLPALEAQARQSVDRAPGTAVVLPGRPLHIRAVIHELDEEPTWRDEWIVAAAVASLTAGHHRGLTRLAMPLLGTVHGRAPVGQAIEALARALCLAASARPHELLLAGAPAGAAETLSRRVPPPDEA